MFSISDLVISLGVTLLLVSLVFYYFRQRITVLENLHMEQARVLQSLIVNMNQREPQMNAPMYAGQTARTEHAEHAEHTEHNKELIQVSDDDDDDVDDSGSDSSEESDTNSDDSGDDDVDDIDNLDDGGVANVMNDMVDSVAIENDPQIINLNGALEDVTQLEQNGEGVKIIEVASLEQQIEVLEDEETGDADESSIEDDSDESEEEESDESEDEGEEEEDEGEEELNISSMTGIINEPNYSTESLESKGLSIINYKKMPLRKLREVAVTKGVLTDAKGMKKNDLVKLLESHN